MQTLSVRVPVLTSTMVVLLMVWPHVTYADAIVSGTLQQWHTVTLSFDGPDTSEVASTNPFTDYRLDVDFLSPTGTTITVPGFYATDGVAAATGATAGNKWQVRFMPTEVGQWNYNVNFETGNDVATADNFGTGTTSFAGSFHGNNGQLPIIDSDKTGRDFRAPDHGLLTNRGHHYLTYAGGKPWVKGGAGIPENLLGYYGFDNTASQNNSGPDYSSVPAAEDHLHRYPDHLGDWNVGDPDWMRNDGAASTQANAGRQIIGAINYLASTGANSVYFLPMNLGGDGQDTYPFISTDSNDKTRYDVSKLEQWHTVFQHAQSKGVLLHFILAETEPGNENFFDGGELGNERKLFYRELVARFGSVPGVEFNIGEENDFSDSERIAFAQFLKSIDPYDHPVANHTNTNQFDTYEDLLGLEAFDMTSFQTNNTAGTLADRAEQWRQMSAAAGVPLVFSVDEPQRIDDDENDENLGYPSIRRRFTWPMYLSGGGGFELYVQQDGGGHSLDQEIENLRDMDLGLRQIGHALAFLQELPLLSMNPGDDLLRGEDSDFGGAQVLADPGSVYAIYLPDASNDDNSGGPPELDLRDFAGERFALVWYDPRIGEYADGSITELIGGDWVSIGFSPDGFQDTSDWAALVTFIPEPGSLAILLVAAPLLLHRRRQAGAATRQQMHDH